MAFLVERLEKCLRAWEDQWFLVESINTAFAGRGMQTRWPDAVKNSSRLRKKLLSVRDQPLDVYDFLPVGDGKSCTLFNLPSFLASWCLHSRRVYYLTEELQGVLANTSLEGVAWRDLSLPFPCYAISLQRPVLDENGKSFDFVCVNLTKLMGPEALEMIFLSREWDSYEPMSRANRQNIENRLRNREWARSAKVCMRFMKNVYHPLHGVYLKCDVDLEIGASAVRICENDSEQEIVFMDSMLRFVAGMCLYLKTLPSGSPHRSEWRPVPRSGLADPRAISNEAQVCTVSSCYTLTRPERVALGLEGTAEERRQYELSCHFRQGHWRRPPGQGHIPEAPKTVHVRPCLVRKDRLQDSELPGGSEATVR